MPGSGATSLAPARAAPHGSPAPREFRVLLRSRSLAVYRLPKREKRRKVHRLDPLEHAHVPPMPGSLSCAESREVHRAFNLELLGGPSSSNSPRNSEVRSRRRESAWSRGPVDSRRCTKSFSSAAASTSSTRSSGMCSTVLPLSSCELGEAGEGASARRAPCAPTRANDDYGAPRGRRRSASRRGGMRRGRR